MSTALYTEEEPLTHASLSEPVQSLAKETADLRAAADAVQERIANLESFIVTSPKDAIVRRLKAIDLIPADFGEDHLAPPGTYSDRMTQYQRQRQRRKQVRSLAGFAFALSVCVLLALWLGNLAIG